MASFMRMKGVRVHDGVWLSVGGEAVFVPDREEARVGEKAAGSDPVSPMPGRIVKVFVKAGDSAKGGDPLVALEAMKMEYLVKAPGDGKVGRVLCEPGQTVGLGQKLLDWEPA